MSFPATIAPAILDTILGRLALLFITGAAGDLTVARHAARQMLAAYNAETPGELGLAAEIVSLQFHTLEAPSYASGSELSLNQILRLRGSAVSLSRESHKARRKLDQLQRARRAGDVAQPAEVQPATPIPQPEITSNRPRIDKALGLIESVREAIGHNGKKGGDTWTQSFQKRQTAKRIAENLNKKRAREASHSARAKAQQGSPVSDADLPRDNFTSLAAV
jgi:hypothetical protein